MLYRVNEMGKAVSKTELRFTETEPPQANGETLQRRLDAALYAVSTAACSGINQNRAKKGELPVTEAQARDIVLLWANE
jgi:hypothetical protein